MSKYREYYIRVTDVQEDRTYVSFFFGRKQVFVQVNESLRQTLIDLNLNEVGKDGWVSYAYGFACIRPNSNLFVRAYYKVLGLITEKWEFTK